MPKIGEISKGLLEAAGKRGMEREHEMGCKASPLDLTIYTLEIAYERGFTPEEAHDVAEVIQDIWDPPLKLSGKMKVINIGEDE